MQQGIHPAEQLMVRKGLPMLIKGIPFAVQNIANMIKAALTDRNVHLHHPRVLHRQEARALRFQRLRGGTHRHPEAHFRGVTSFYPYPLLISLFVA